MLYLLDKTTKTVKWNGVPLHEAISAIAKEVINGEFSLVVKYPITDSDVYKQIKEDMLIKAKVPVIGPQLFRVKKPVEHNDYLELTCRHITEDIMTRSIRPFGNQQLGCLAALTNMLEHSKTDLSPFSFDSDITSRHTFNTEKDETLYSVLLDGKHSIVGTWEGELERNNYTLTVKRSRGQNRGVIISSHFNLDEYQRERSTENVVTRIYATSTFKEEGHEEDTVLKVTVDSPLINQYPYINEQEYENNNAKTIEELRQWAEAKFTHGHIDKLSDKIVVKAFLLDGQSVHIGDTVTLKSSKHDIDIERKCVGYEYDVLSEQYISLTFDDKVPVGSSGGTSGVSNLAETVISVGKTQSDIALDRAIENANRVFDEKFERNAEDLQTGIEVAKAKAQQFKSELESKINAEIKPLANEAKQSADRANQSIASQVQEMQQLRTTLADNKREVLAEANQAATNAFNRAEQLLNQSQSTLSGEIAAVSQTLSETKRNLLEQARAQTELSSRVTTVEETANGTKTTVTELQKTVNATTGNLDAVSRRTKTVEDNLSGLTAKFENIRVGGRNYFLNSNFAISSGSRMLKIHPDFLNHAQGKKIIISVEVEGSSVVARERGRFGLAVSAERPEQSNRDWLEVWEVGTGDISKKRIFKVFDFNENWENLAAGIYIQTGGQVSVGYPMLEIGEVPSDYRPSEEDYRSELATYKQTVDQNFAELTRTTQTVSDSFTEYKSAFDQTAERFRISLNALEAFQNDEGARESRYLSLSREETARQLQTVRSDITRDYVSKSQLAETTRGIEQRFERLRVGGRNLLASKFLNGVETSEHFRLKAWATTLMTPENVRQVFKSGQTYTISFDAEIVGKSSVSNVYGLQVGMVLHSATTRRNIDCLLRPSNRTAISELNQKGRFELTFTCPELADDHRVYIYTNRYASGNQVDCDTVEFSNVNLTEGNIVYKDWLPPDEDSRQEFATYKNTVDRQLSELSSTINANNSAFTTFKNSYERTAQGVTEKLTALEAYKNNEHLRSNAYLEASKTETAKQLQTLRTAISEDYVAKSIYEENAEGVTRRFEKLNEALSDKVSSSTFTQKFDEILSKVQTLDGEVMKTNSFTINENGIVLQSGRTFDGRTMATMFAQDPENISIIARLLRVNADMIVNGSITGRHVKANSLETGHHKAGSVTAEVLGAGAVTAEKMLVNQAMINKLMTDDLLARAITASTVFATSVQAVDISAARVTSGILASRNGATSFDLDTGALVFATNSPAIRRTIAGLPNQFVKFASKTEANDNSFKTLVNERKTSALASVTSIGTNRANGESTTDGSFTGINIFASGPNTGVNVIDRIGIHSDITIISHSVAEGQKGWVFENHNSSNNDFTLRPMASRKSSNYSSFLGTTTHTITNIYTDEIVINGHRLKALLKDLASRTGKYDGWARDFG